MSRNRSPPIWHVPSDRYSSGHPRSFTSLCRDKLRFSIILALVKGQLRRDVIYATTYTNQKLDAFPNDFKVRRSERFLGTIFLNFSCWCFHGIRSILHFSYPPVSLLIGALSSRASRVVVTESRLVVKYRTSRFPVIYATLKVKSARSCQR